MKKFYGFFFVLLVILIFPVRTFADDIDNRIGELQQKITQLQGQENTLSKQINLLNSQIALTTLRLSNTRAAIIKLDTEIGELEEEIDRLETLLFRRSELVLHRIPESYKRKAVSNFGLLLFSQNFSDFVSRLEYLSQVQEQDVALLFQLKATQSHFNERKNLREQIKMKQEALKKQQERESQELEQQKRDKQALLTQTQNDEAVYQQLLAQALAEKQAVERALVEGVRVGAVKTGDPIALVGNSGYPGCSTGAHLHFEVRKNNAWVDPGVLLSSKTVIDEQTGGNWTTGSGSWQWPLQDTVRITQHFGQTPYSWRYTYSGGIHTGYDMISNTSSVIRAPHDGTLFSSSQPCGGSSIIKIKYIDHGDSTISFYLHVQ